MRENCLVITSENARELQQKAAVARRLKAEERRLVRVAAIVAAQAEGYVNQTLVRVRLQLDSLYSAFMKEVGKQSPDAAKLDRIASAQSRLAEQERQLSGRPMPGSLRPTADKPRRQPAQLPEPEDLA